MDDGPPATPPPGRKPPGALVFALLYTLHSLAQATTITIIPLEALRILGSARDASILFFAVSTGTFLARFAIPMLIRRLRQRRVFVGGYLLVAAAPLVMASGFLPGLVVGMLLRVFGGACCGVNLNLYIMRYVRKEDLTRVEPFRLGLSAFAWAGGPTLGVLLFERVDPLAAFGAACAFGLLALAFFLWLRLADDPGDAGGVSSNPLRFIVRFFRQMRLVQAWLIGVGRQFWWNLFMVYGPVYLVTSGADSETAAYIVSAGMIAMSAAFAFGWVARRVGVRNVITGGFLGGAVATLAIVPLGHAWMWGAVFLLIGAVAVTACDSVGNILFYRMVRKRERPEMTMVYLTFGDTGNLLSTAIYSVLLSHFDMWIVFAVTGTMLIGATTLARQIPRGL